MTEGPTRSESEKPANMVRHIFADAQGEVYVVLSSTVRPRGLETLVMVHGSTILG